MYVFYLSFNDFILLSFIISNTNKDDFSSIWKWVSCYNDVMSHVDCIMKRDVYPQKMHYLPLDGMVNVPIYLVWASWVRNGTTFLSDNRYFEIQT